MSYAINVLERKYALYLGMAKKESTTDQLEEIDEILDAIQTVIRLWEPDWTPDHIKPIRPKRRYVPHGVQSKFLFKFVRESSTEFTARDAANHLGKMLTGAGYEVPPLSNRISFCHNTLTGFEDKAIVRIGNRPRCWRKK